MEEEISSLYKVIDDASLTKAELEQQMESMRSELRHLEQNHEQVHQTMLRVALFCPTSFAELYISSVIPPARMYESCTTRWQDARWTNLTLPLKPVWTRSWPTSETTGRR